MTPKLLLRIFSNFNHQFTFPSPFPAKNIVSQFFWVYRKVTQGSTKKIVEPVTGGNLTMINIFYHQTDLLFQERNVSVLKTVMKVYFCHGFMPISFPVLIKEALESSMKKIGPTFVCYVGPGDEWRLTESFHRKQIYAQV